MAILPVYPARELPIEGVSSESIAQYMDKQKTTLPDKSEIENFLKQNSPKLLVTMGAGDIDKELENIKNILLKKQKSVYE